MSNDDSGNPYFMQYPQDFFDFIIIDECHRGGANDESEWRRLMEYFSDAYQLGMTATPKDEIDHNTFELMELEEPNFEYTWKEAVKEKHIVDCKGFDFSTIDTEEGYGYWQHMDYIVDMSAANGIYVGMIADTDSAWATRNILFPTIRKKTTGCTWIRHGATNQ